MVDDNNKKFGSFEVGDSGMKFEGEQRYTHSYPETPKIIQWVIKYSGG